MRPEGTFIAERVAAQHCAELLRGTRQAVNPLKELALLGGRMADLFAPRLAQLCAGAPAVVEAGEAVELAANAGHDRRAEPVLNTVLQVGPRDVMLIASMPRRAVLSLVDIALGGSGKEWALPGGKLPVSARLMHGRFEKLLVAMLAEVLELPDPEMVRLKDAGPLADTGTPFAGCKRTVLPLQISLAGGEPAELTFVFPGSSLATLFAGRAAQASAAAPAIGKPSPMAEPFGGIPLPLRAILVDMAIPVSTLSRLRPGMVIPVSVARNVPLIAGGQVVAQGTVGAMDDRTALQINHIISNKGN